MTAITAEAGRIWARHAALPVPTDLRDDADLTELSAGVSGIATAFMKPGRLAPTEEAWLRGIRPDLHRRFLSMRASSERGYVESLLAVVVSLLSTSRLA